jgi:hypothetical protein
MGTLTDEWRTRNKRERLDPEEGEKKTFATNI